LGEAVAGGYPPGATVLVVDAEGELLRVFGGWSCVVSESIPTCREKMDDLASLTKVVSTGTLPLSLAQRGVWAVDDPAAQLLPGFAQPGITLRQLLTHTSGLPAHREFYRLEDAKQAIRGAVFSEARNAEPGQVVYSDLGYMLLGWAIEETSGIPL